ncbi:MAG: NYN domain-containing protein [Desulfobacterales bacterium]|nr:NYN domain-containing protein [Desulfobacterales bacterium]
MTVVFDAYNRESLRETAAVRGGVKVIFTRHGDRADDVIKRIIADKSRERIVITSDRDIEHFAWSAGSIPVPSDLFSEILKDHGRDRQSGQDGGGSAEETRDPDEPDYAGSRPRGNPHRMSRREKALRRALGKL